MLLGGLAALGAWVAWLLHATIPPEPALGGALESDSLEHDGRTRTFTRYVPANLPEGAPLVLVFHGSTGDGARVRAGFGFAWDELADRHGFVVLYPDGFDRHWNGCRKAGPYEANLQNVDDVGFSRTLVDAMHVKHGIDEERVYATGVSNGGHMALRLALEAPDLVRAVAPVIANQPSPENLGCTPQERPVSLLLMNGTDDPMNPYTGGRVALYGLVGDRGAVWSTDRTVHYWRALAGLHGEPAREWLPDLDPEDGSTVERKTWSAPGRKRVVLVTVHGGGHSVPHPRVQAPRIIGATNHDVVAAEEIWRFFADAP